MKYINIHRISAFVGMLTMFLLFSCAEEDRVISPSSGDKVLVEISLNVEKMSPSLQTRSDEQELNLGGESLCAPKEPVSRSVNPSFINENSVTNLWMLQYINGVFVQKQYVSSISDLYVKIKVPLVANTGSETSTIYFIANVGSSVFQTSVPTSETDILSDALDCSTESGLFPTTGYVPMSASITGVSVSSSSSAGFNVNLKRMLARVDVSYNIVDSLYPSYTFKARLCNVPNKLYFYSPSEGSLFPATVTTWNTDYSGLSAASGTLTFYVPDNRRGTGANAGTNEKLKEGIADAAYVEFEAQKTAKKVTYRIYPGANTYNDYNICRNNQYKIVANVNNSSELTDRRVYVSSSNCCIVALGGTTKIRVSQANNSDLGRQLPSLTAGWTPSVIWRDNSAMSLSVSTALQSQGFFEVTVSGGTGNALVCIKDGSNNILWSWHIWVTGYNPQITSYPYNGFTWMDRSLGANNNTVGDVGSYGYHYQYGRKDPFVPAASGDIFSVTPRKLYAGNSGTTVYTIPAPTEVSQSNNLQNSIRNPTLFYTAPMSGLLDWYTNQSSSAFQNLLLWGKDAKTVYDPCPAGWRVPPINSYDGLSSLNFPWDSTYFGRKYSGVWFPACSFYKYEGIISAHDFSFGGYFWMADKAGSPHIVLSNSAITVNGSASRACGINVRCVKE